MKEETGIGETGNRKILLQKIKKENSGRNKRKAGLFAVICNIDGTDRSKAPFANSWCFLGGGIPPLESLSENLFVNHLKYEAVYIQTNLWPLVRKRTIPIERPPLVDEI
jgi:hypothetical protein